MTGRVRCRSNFSLDCALYYKGFSGAQAKKNSTCTGHDKELHGFKWFSDSDIAPPKKKSSYTAKQNLSLYPGAIGPISNVSIILSYVK